MSESIFTVPACAQETLILTWQPVKSDGFRHVVHVKDAKKNKKISEIIVTGTCVSPIKVSMIEIFHNKQFIIEKFRTCLNSFPFKK